VATEATEGWKPQSKFLKSLKCSARCVSLTLSIYFYTFSGRPRKENNGNEINDFGHGGGDKLQEPTCTYETAGSLGVGCDAYAALGGAGGGGYFGGGGSSNGGGGGGSSYSLYSVVDTGYNTGDGYAVIEWDWVGPSATPSLHPTFATTVEPSLQAVLCPNGTTLLTNSCVVCPAGTYSVTGFTKCVTCPAGSYSGAWSDSCLDCPVGHYCTEGAAFPIMCSAGSVSVAGASVCSPCANGEYSYPGTSTCLSCSA